MINFKTQPIAAIYRADSKGKNKNKTLRAL